MYLQHILIANHMVCLFISLCSIHNMLCIYVYTTYTHCEPYGMFIYKCLQYSYVLYICIYVIYSLRTILFVYYQSLQYLYVLYICIYDTYTHCEPYCLLIISIFSVHLFCLYEFTTLCSLRYMLCL